MNEEEFLNETDIKIVFVCKQCQKRFKKQNLFENFNEELFVCGQCEKRFEKGQPLKSHVKNVHEQSFYLKMDVELPVTKAPNLPVNKALNLQLKKPPDLKKINPREYKCKTEFARDKTKRDELEKQLEECLLTRSLFFAGG